MKPLSTDQEPAGRTQCALSAVRCQLSAKASTIAVAIALAVWLRADTKPEPEPEPDATRRMVTIDGPKQRVYPLSLAAKHSFKALDLRLATEQLKAKEPDLDTTAAALLRYDTALQSIEAEVGE